MAKGEQLIDSHVSLKQCKKAVEALHAHELKKKEKFEENQLLPAKEQHIWLNVTLKTIPAGHRLKPVKIPIVHPLVDPRTTPVCLITKDPQRQYKDLLETHNIKFISRVVGIEKLKGKFKPFEARRMLLKENGLFLADERVLPLLPKLLGSKWFEAKKQPIPVCLTRKDLKGELERAISSTYMNQNQGTCTSIKVGKMSQTPSQILENIKTALPAVAKAVKGSWDNIQSFNIKTNSSMSLPIWSCTLDDAEGGRWNGLLAESDEEEDEDEEVGDEEDEVDTAKSKKAPVQKGRKRPSSSDEEQEQEEKPRKKAKAADGAVKTKEKVLSTKHSKLASAHVDSIAHSKKHKTNEPSSTPAEVPASSGKKGQKAKSSAGAESTASPKGPVISEAVDKKQKRSQTSAPTPVAPSSAPPTTDTPLKKKKTSKAQSTSDTASSKKPELSPSADTTAAPSGAQDTSAKEKKKKTSKTADAVVAPSAPEKSAKSSLTKEEMKQKRRSAGVGEKKKEIIAKAKGGKSVKNAVLGRKVAQD